MANDDETKRVHVSHVAALDSLESSRCEIPFVVKVIGIKTRPRQLKSTQAEAAIISQENVDRINAAVNQFGFGVDELNPFRQLVKTVQRHGLYSTSQRYRDHMLCGYIHSVFILCTVQDAKNRGVPQRDEFPHRVCRKGGQRRIRRFSEYKYRNVHSRHITDWKRAVLGLTVVELKERVGNVNLFINHKLERRRSTAIRQRSGHCR